MVRVQRVDSQGGLGLESELTKVSGYQYVSAEFCRRVAIRDQCGPATTCLRLHSAWPIERLDITLGVYSNA